MVIAARLRRLADDHPLTVSDTWRTAACAMHLNVLLYDVPGAGRGEFCPSLIPPILGDIIGLVAINTAYPEPDQCRAWIHELAHAELHHWHPPQLEECRDAWMYEGNPADVRHRIARRVEELVLGPNPDRGPNI